METFLVVCYSLLAAIVAVWLCLILTVDSTIRMPKKSTKDSEKSV